MSYENLTYLDAEKFCKKKYLNQDDFALNPSEFPPLVPLRQPLHNSQSQGQSTNLITPSQRRSFDFSNNTKRSFQQAVIKTPTKRRIIETGFNRETHNKNLFFPNGRPDKETSSQPTFSIIPSSSVTSKSQPPFSANSSASYAFQDSAPYNCNQNLPKVIMENFLTLSHEDQTKIREFIITHHNFRNHRDWDNPNPSQ